ncbi:MAG: acetyl/propionyl/methylcrotonyl-CoA carboxylase subunit alpha [Pseudomonadota bacterium]
MFTKILIANRGEIACRVIRTARRMGVATVAVYSDADARSLHVAEADEAVRIGPAPVSASYLQADTIIAAAKATGAQAIHPGFGFLSENPDFVEAVEKAGLTFIGPSAAAIRAMGLKDAAKKLMEEAGVPVVPGYHGAEQDPDFLAKQADKIGYPVLIKARAGGGGKGMRRVDDPADFSDALASASSEGLASFGDGAVLIEKYILSPRHIEIQVFGDGTDAVHLFERDCSLQRRHQKVIEEAPAPGMTDEVRRAMGDAAVTAAKAIGYAGAGTIEFIVDGANGLRPDGFWFMEMNTRLQVEHPVTEEITGVDLVEWQLRVAAGEPIPKRQQDLSINGWSFEARLYAEDAARGFLPATGRLDHLKFPDNARIETGVRPGDEITPFYDPMIAKIITRGADRTEALSRMRAALLATEVAGSVTNVAFLAHLAAHEGFARGEVDTGLIARDQAALTALPPTPPLARAIAALSATVLTGPQTWQTGGWRLWEVAKAFIALTDGAEALRAVVEISGESFTVTMGEEAISLTARPMGDLMSIHHEGRDLTARAVRHGTRLTVFLDGLAHEFGVPDPLAVGGDGAAGGDMVLSPMPGLVKTMNAAAGQSVEQGAPLCVLEAMKMEHTLKAPRAGTIASVGAAAGDQVEEGTILIKLEPEDG